MKCDAFYHRDTKRQTDLKQNNKKNDCFHQQLKLLLGNVFKSRDFAEVQRLVENALLIAGGRKLRRSRKRW